MIIDLKGLIDYDTKTKGPMVIEDWRALQAYYEDQGRSLTKEHLQKMQVGLAEDPRPLEIQLLRRIVDRLATIYDRSPNRFLRIPGGEGRLKEAAEEHKLMVSVYRRAQVDVALRLMDRWRALLRQVLVRYYWSEHKQSVVLRLFTPDNVLRRPDPQSPDCIEADLEFALRIGDKLYEYWKYDPKTKARTMFIVDEAGTKQNWQPYEADGLSPFGDELPAQMIYDDAAVGRPWLPPRSSRRAWVEKINMITNELLVMIVNTAHKQKVVETDDPDGAKEGLAGVGGPRITLMLPAGSKLTALDQEGAMSDSQSVLEMMFRAWAISEDLPGEEWAPGRQVVTGAALKVLDRPLGARREAQIPLALEDERLGYRKLRAVHNYHSKGPKLPDAELEVEIAEIDVPSDGAIQGQQDEADLKLGLTSRLTLVQRKKNLTREQAAEYLYRTDAENALFTGPLTDAAPPERGTVGAQVDALTKLNEAVKIGFDRKVAVDTVVEVFGFEKTKAEKLIVPQGKEPEPAKPEGVPADGVSGINRLAA